MKRVTSGLPSTKHLSSVVGIIRIYPQLLGVFVRNKRTLSSGNHEWLLSLLKLLHHPSSIVIVGIEFQRSPIGFDRALSVSGCRVGFP